MTFLPTDLIDILVTRSMNTNASAAKTTIAPAEEISFASPYAGTEARKPPLRPSLPDS